MEKNIKDHWIKVRVTKEEKEKIAEYAERLGFSTSVYARNILLWELDSLAVKSGVDEKMIKAVIYLKELFTEPNIRERLKED